MMIVTRNEMQARAAVPAYRMDVDATQADEDLSAMLWDSDKRSAEYVPES